MLAEVLQESESIWTRLFTSDFWTGELWTAAFWNQEVAQSSSITLWLLCVGLFGQAMFFSRFLVQWMVSERAKKSVFPMAFWYLSLSGGTILFIYAYQRNDPVIMLGQAVGLIVYTRNVILRRREVEVVED
jgi:lipid-A-disaccharide synthase-like uncharacterized protein